MITVKLNEATEVELWIYRGMDTPLSITVTDHTGAAVNLTGYTVKILVADAEGSGDNLVNGTFTIGGASSNVITYDFTDDATANTATYPSECYYEVQWLDSSGKYRKLMYGKITMADSLSFSDTP